MDNHLRFIKALFEMEHGLMVSSVRQTGFSTYLVTDVDGNTHAFRG